MRKQFLLWLLLLTSLCACGKKAGDGSNAALENTLLEPHQREVLQLAFDAATAIPVEPHIKDRSRAQQEVVFAALELDQPGKALEWTQRIENWRRGVCLAEIAVHLARREHDDEARRQLDLAAQLAESAEDWRRDRIRAGIARVFAVLGEDDRADEFAADLADAEKGQVLQADALVVEADAFDVQMRALDEVVSTDTLDIVRNALDAYATLFDRFYDDAERRETVEAGIRSAWSPLPIFLRIELLMELADTALKHGDAPKGLEFLNDAQGLLDEHTWPPQYNVALRARLAELRWRANDEAAALDEIQRALDLYEEGLPRIVNIYRAETLRSLARAWHTMGDREAALAMYKRVLDAGIENPNSRPRAQDLSATCRAMAAGNFEPDAELLRRAHEIYEGLGQPW